VEAKFLVLIIGMMIVTYLPRLLPLAILTKLDIPPLLIRWLSYIPPAVLAALITPSILAEGRSLNLGFDNKFLLASLPTFLIAIKTRSLVLTVVVGMAIVMVLNIIIG